MSTEPKHELSERLTKAYGEIMEHAHAALEHAHDNGLPDIKHALESARDKVVSLGNISREDADKVVEFVHRDLVHAAVYLELGRRELSDWLRFDVQQLEQRIARVLARMVDHTRETLDELAVSADAIGWKTGEIVGPGTLHCKNCGQALHFHEAGHVPPCPKCKHTLYARDHEVG